MYLLEVYQERNDRGYDLSNIFISELKEYQTTMMDESWIEIVVTFRKTIKALNSINVFIGAGANASQPAGFEVYANGVKIAERLGILTGGVNWTKSKETVVLVDAEKINILTNEILVRIKSYNHPSYPLIIPIIQFEGEEMINKYLFKDGEEIKKWESGISGSNAVVDMTSNTAPSGIASASSVDNPTTRQAWNAFDGYIDTAWMSGFTNITNQWIQYKFGSSKTIASYIINPYTQSMSPKDFMLQGSNDGITFINLDIQTNVTEWSEGVKKVFNINPASVGAYLYYRLFMSKNNGSNTAFAIKEFELLTPDISSEWKFLGISQETKELFDIHGMSDLSIITNEAIQQLQSDQVELLCWTDEVTPSRQVGITGLPVYVLMTNPTDITINDAEKVTLLVKQATGDMIRIAVSSDDGVTWKGKSPLTLNDITSVKANGFTPEELNALTKEQLATLFPNGTARFAFYLEQDNITDVVEIQSLSVGEKQYTISPTATDLSLIYEVLQEEKPTLYASRDDGVSWKEISQDEMASLSEQPEGKSLRVKAVLKNGQEIHALSYAWA